jgi:cystathionine gamma-synthase/methionine-gamma-lyase
MTERSIYTLAVHAGERALRTEPKDGATYTPVVTPIHHSVGYTYADSEDLDAVFAGESETPVYARYGNPTVYALEAAVAALEGAEAALAYGSGMAAIHGALLAAGARAGTCVVAAHDVYGATYAVLDKLMRGNGMDVRFVDVTDLDAVRGALSETRPVALLVETISNPLLKVADLPRLAEAAHETGAALIVDNTFATPVLCRPLSLGADFCVHSATKYLGGHGDALGGAVATSHIRRWQMNEINKLLGANLGPQEAWLIHRGIKTLPLRFLRQCANAAQIAGWLAAHPRIAKVNYPGLADHPQHDLADELLGGQFGAMVSFELRDPPTGTKGSRAEVFRFMDSLRLIQPATTLGDVYTLVLYPAMSSHRALSPAMRRRIGIGDGLVRLSAGIEDVGDVIADLEQALAAIA